MAREKYDPALDLHIISQVYALRVAVTALLDAHPRPQSVLPAFDHAAEYLRADILTRPLPDEFYRDFDATVEALRKRLTRE